MKSWLFQANQENRKPVWRYYINDSNVSRKC